MTTTASATQLRNIESIAPASGQEITVYGNISLNSQHWVKGVKAPTSSSDLMTKSFADSEYLNRDGTDTMAGNLDLNGNTLTNAGSISFSGGENIYDGTNLRFDSNSGFLDFRPADATHGLIIRDFDGSSTSWSGIRTQDNGEMQLRADGASYSQLVLEDSGEVGVGTSNPGTRLDVNGKARATRGEFTSGLQLPVGADAW